MGITPPPVKLAPKPSLTLRFSRLDGGLNYNVVASQISDTQTPDCLNINFDERGAIQKRWGYERVYTESLGEGQINSIYDYYKIGATSPVFLIHHGTKIYKDNSGTLTSIASGLKDAPGKWFTFNDIAYYMNGTDFKQYDGNTLKDVVPYVPTITLGREPDGSAFTQNEELNYLTGRFKDSFSPDGTATVFVLSYGITEDVTSAIVDGVAMSEGNGYTVDRTKTPAEVVFDAAPQEGIDSVVIEATMINPPDATVVTKCRFAEVYGGKNDTRVIYGGNPEVPNLLLYSGLFQPGYVPISGYVLVGSDAEGITAYRRFYDYLVILKQRSIWVMQGSDPDNYTINPINDRYGCIATDSSVIIENDVVFLSQDGVCRLQASTVREYLNVEVISDNINGGASPGLLNVPESELQQAKSIDYDNKYWLCLPDNTVYLWDYRLSSIDKVWLKYDNFPVSCLLKKDRTLYFGSSTEGLVYRVPITKASKEEYLDDGTPINAYWKSKLHYMDMREWEKYFHFLYFSVKVNKRIGLYITYYTSLGETEVNEQFAFDTFSYENFTYNKFYYGGLTFPPSKRVRVRKRGEYFQVKFSNNTAGEGLSLLDMVIAYELRRQVK